MAAAVTDGSRGGIVGPYPNGRCCVCPHTRNRNFSFFRLRQRNVAPQDIYFSKTGRCKECAKAPTAIFPPKEDCESDPRTKTECHTQCQQRLNELTESYTMARRGGSLTEVVTTRKHVAIRWNDQDSIFESLEFATLTFTEPGRKKFRTR